MDLNRPIPRLFGICFALSLFAVPGRTAAPGTDVIVMLDMSMDAENGDPDIRTLAGGARVAAMELKPGDRASLVTYSKDAKAVLPLTGDLRKFESALGKTGKWIVQRQQRHLYDSLFTVLSTLPAAASPDRRRCILVLTTASDAGSRHTANEVALNAKSRNTAIFIALLSPPPSFPHVLPGGRVYPHGPNANSSEEKKMLDPLTRETGGDVRIYEGNQYVIARAIDEMVNR